MTAGRMVYVAAAVRVNEEASKCAEPCCDRRPSQRVTCLIETRTFGARYYCDDYCVEHAAAVAEEIAHGNPPNVTLVSVEAMPAVEPCRPRRLLSWSEYSV